MGGILFVAHEDQLRSVIIAFKFRRKRKKVTEVVDMEQIKQKSSLTELT